MSPKAAGLAVKMGYTNVKVYLQGDPGWVKEGKSVVASDKHVNTGNIVLVDLRSPAEAQNGHIKGAVNIPLAKLAEAEDAFPEKKSAPIVLYGNGNDAEQAAATVRGWGYKTVSLLNGGLDQYVARGNKLAAGPAATEIKWVRRLEEGEVGVAEFMKAVEGKTGQVILDVRGKEELGGGMFKNAVNIPLDQIEKRKAELPQDKEILVHCTTGARADLACRSLTKAGYKVRFLVADVECEGGTCRAAD